MITALSPNKIKIYSMDFPFIHKKIHYGCVTASQASLRPYQSPRPNIHCTLISFGC